MCGRFTLTIKDHAELASLLGVSLLDPALAAEYRPRYNIAPTDPHWIVRAEDGQRALVGASWGMFERRQINARGETAARRLKKAFAGHRCLVPADGFYEWTTDAEGKRQPIWFHSPDQRLLLLAGLFEELPGGCAVGERRFTILTIAPNEVVAPIHDRMPLVIAPEDATRWLAAPPAEAEALVRTPPAEALVGRRVSPRVSSVKHDDPSLLEDPGPSAESKGQLRLL